MRNILFLLAFSLIFIYAGCSEDDNPADSGGGGTNITGTVVVKATQAPVSGAIVSLGDQLETTTDASGKFTLSNVPTVKQDFRVEKSGYAVFIEDFTPVKGANTFDVELETIIEFCNRVPSVVYRGKTYNTVMVGSNCWFKENLNAGNFIRWEGDWQGGEEQPNNTVLEKYCANNIESNCDKWGGLYTWNEAMNHQPTHSDQGICPDGWRIPSLDEFLELGVLASNNGNALRAVGEGDGTDDFGWSALNATTHFMENAGAGPVLWIGSTRWWSSSEVDDNNALNFGFWGATIISETNLKILAFSVRCVKD